MAALSGQVTVTTAGTAVQAGTDPGPGQYLIKALDGNSGNIYVGNDGAGDVTSANGYELGAGDVMAYTGQLASLWFDSAENGDKACWVRVKRTED